MEEIHTDDEYMDSSTDFGSIKSPTDSLVMAGEERFCAICLPIIKYAINIAAAEKWTMRMRDFPLHLGASMVKKAADGCPMCMLFLTTIETIGSTLTYDLDHLSSVVVAQYWPQKRDCAHLGMDMTPFGGDHIMFRLWPKQQYTDRANTTTYKHDAQVLPLVAEWFANCASSHEGNDANARFLPSRLVSLLDPEPRLVLKSELDPNPEYATLSHCWGSTKFTTLTQGKVADFQDQIPPQALSQTFLDSFTVAKHLGICYIWIDSLCIIQDSTSDWLEESANMGEIYANSVLTIAASSASDGSKGFLLRRDEHRHHFFDAEASDKGDVKTFRCMYDSIWSMVENSPLALRGWVLQERLLASRTVHFTVGQVFWECKKSDSSCNIPRACEIFRWGMPEYEKCQYYTFNKKTDLRDEWHEIVQRYSRCKLTLGSDKLIAISGIARAVQRRRQQANYIVGFFVNEDHDTEKLICQLDWQCSKVVQGPSPPRVPSWSWSAVDSAVVFSDSVKSGSIAEPGAEIIDRDIVYQGDDIFGSVLFARLTVACDLLIAFKPGPAFHSWALRLNFDQALDRELQKRRLIALPLWEHWNPKTDKKYHGVILCPENTESGRFRRIGRFEVGQNSYPIFNGAPISKRITQSTLVAAFGERSEPLTESDYISKQVDASGKTKYIISLD